MGKRSRPDHYTDRAKKAGFSARSVYKLEELDKRFGLISQGDAVLDVGAAPGSWTQYAAKRVGRSGCIVAVDLKEMPDLGGLDQVVAFAGDIYNEGTIGRVESHAPFDLVMSDAAPNTSGNRSLDTARSAALVEHVVALADRMLKPGGNFVAKIFQGGEEQALLDQLRQLYRTARLIKPKASRSESFETFLVGLGFGGGGQ